MIMIPTCQGHTCALLQPADVEMKVVTYTYENDGLVTEGDEIINKVFSFLCICSKSTQNEISRHLTNAMQFIIPVRYKHYI